MDAEASPARQVDAYVTAALALAQDRTHRSLQALASADLPPECHARLAELHDTQTAPLVDALRALGDRDAALTARLVSGLVRAASQAVAEGAPVARVRRRTLALVHQGIGS
jgi:hypothetical protein